MEIFSKGLRLCPSVTSLNLKDNRISPKGANTLLQDLNKKIKIIDLSYNSIGKSGCEQIYRILMLPDYRFHFFNIKIYFTINDFLF